MNLLKKFVKMSADSQIVEEHLVKNEVLENVDAKEASCIDSNESSVQCPENNLDRDTILSRRKQKKLLKQAKWKETRKLRRLRERQKKKERRAKEVELGLPGPASKRKMLKRNKMVDSPNLVSVAVDFDFEELMLDKDIAKCSKQMLRVYTENRKSHMPIKLHFTSIKENSRIEKSLSRHDGYTNWDVNIHRESYLNLFDHNSIVYLTSDSDNVLNELQPNTVYIIGGLVDHNHHKGLTFERALEKGLRTARLPLSEHIEMKTRSVLTIVHVFEILLRVSEGKPWKETLLDVLPQRKFRIGPKKRKHKSTNETDSEDDNSVDNKHEENIKSLEETPNESSLS